MSKKGMRRSPTSRNERRKAITAKHSLSLVCPHCLEAVRLEDGHYYCVKTACRVYPQEKAASCR